MIADERIFSKPIRGLNSNDIPIVSDKEFMEMLDLRGLKDESAFTTEE